MGKRNVSEVLAGIGTRVREARQRQDLSVVQAAARARPRVGRQHWYAIEAGQVNLSVDTLAALGVALRCDPVELMR